MITQCSIVAKTLCSPTYDSVPFPEHYAGIERLSDDQILAIHQRLVPQDVTGIDPAQETEAILDCVYDEGEDEEVVDLDTTAQRSLLEAQESSVVSDAEVDDDDDVQVAADPYETDDEDSESSSDSESPRRPASARERKPTRVLTYDEKGNAVWQNR